MTETPDTRTPMRHHGHDDAALETHSRPGRALALALALLTAAACGAPGAPSAVAEPIGAAATVEPATVGVARAPTLERAPLEAIEEPALLAYREPTPDTSEPAGALRLATLGPVPDLTPATPSVAAPGAPDRSAWSFFDHADAPTVADLRGRTIQGVERGRGGRSLGFKITFEDGSRAYFKPDQAFNGMSWNAEIAAYQLDRELGFGRVAPVVSRRVAWSELEDAAGHDGRVEELRVSEDGTLIGAMIWWVPERLVPVELPDGWQRWLRVEGAPAAVTPFQRPGAYRVAVAAHRTTAMPASPTPDVPERPAEISDLIVFDYLTNNLDRWGGNNTNIRTVGAGGPVMFLDNAASFTLRRPRNSMMDRRLNEVQRFRRATVEAIRAFDVDAYGERINADPNGPILEELHLRNLETRRRHLLDHVDRLVEAHGEDAVYAW